MKWTEYEIPDLTGQVIVVTGANSGIGYEATTEQLTMEPGLHLLPIVESVIIGIGIVGVGGAGIIF